MRAGSTASGDASAARRMAGIAIAAALGFGWWVVISVMTQIGFSGNDRYLILGAALVEIAGGVGFGWAAIELGRCATATGSGRSGSGGALSAGVGAWAAAGAVGVVLPAAAARGSAGSCTCAGSTGRSSTRRICATDMTKAVRAGRRSGSNVLRCGSVMTEGFQVPMVAWALGVHTLQIEAPPAGGRRAPRRRT